MTDTSNVPSVNSKTLRLSIPYSSDDYCPDRDDYIFKRIPVYGELETAFTEDELRLYAEEVIQETNHSTVYLSKIGDYPVVVKCCDEEEFSNDFRREARVYQKYLREVQGHAVPRFFGYYEAEDDLYGACSCIVLEYCGTSIHSRFERLDDSEKVKILTTLGRVHKSGIHPCDFAERNVVARDGEYRLIDFHDVKIHPNCMWSDSVDWKPGDYVHDIWVDFPCETLFNAAARNMLLWRYNKDPIVDVNGYYLLASLFPPQDVIDKLIPPHFIDGDENMKWLFAYLKKIKAQMNENNGNINIEEELAKQPDPPFVPRSVRRRKCAKISA